MTDIERFYPPMDDRMRRIAEKALQVQKLTGPSMWPTSVVLPGTHQGELEEEPIRTPKFTELNPALQAVIIAFLTGHVPSEFDVTDEQLHRAPDLNADSEVELIIDGTPDIKRNVTHFSIRIIIDGKRASPINRFG